MLRYDIRKCENAWLMSQSRAKMKLMDGAKLGDQLFDTRSFLASGWQLEFRLGAQSPWWLQRSRINIFMAIVRLKDRSLFNDNQYGACSLLVRLRNKHQPSIYTSRPTTSPRRKLRDWHLRHPPVSPARCSIHTSQIYPKTALRGFPSEEVRHF